MELAGENQEIGWMELKQILDHSIPKEIQSKANGVKSNGHQNGKEQHPNFKIFS
jgi:hypothetical protein